MAAKSQGDFGVAVHPQGPAQAAAIVSQGNQLALSGSGAWVQPLPCPPKDLEMTAPGLIVKSLVLSKRAGRRAAENGGQEAEATGQGLPVAASLNLLA